mmetsp:Transcript_11085/g.22085  ORF Transcript_11085/g.22085 Transcript_11085/m.22085 type:complete len:87 (-) Transcript_11085:320-580(-)
MSQRVYLCRYGLRSSELVPYKGPFDMGLHPDGELTARELGAMLKAAGRPMTFFSSPFRRSLTTAAIAAGVVGGHTRVRVEVGVTEW